MNHGISQVVLNNQSNSNNTNQINTFKGYFSPTKPKKITPQTQIQTLAEIDGYKLVKDWSKRQVDDNLHQMKIFELDSALLVFSPLGSLSANI